MALVEAQIQAVKTSAEKAANGDKVAQEFFKQLREGKELFQKEMLELAEEYMKEKNIVFSEPLVDINLQPVQIESARKTLAKLKAEPGNPEVLNFWSALERQAAAGEPISKEYLKARIQILAAMEKEANAPRPDWAVDESKTNPASPQAITPTQPAPAHGPVMGQPEASQVPGQQPPSSNKLLNELQMVKAYRDEILLMRNEIIQARDQILGAIIQAPKPNQASAPETPDAS
jgi:hypothetical protein